MNGNWRTVAFQAIGVAAVAAIIFLAFLRPSEPTDLSGIDAGDPPRVQIGPPPEGPGGKNGRRPTAKPPGKNGGNNGNSTRSRRRGGGGVGGGFTLGGAIQLPLPIVSFPGSRTDDGPPGSQYGDLVARLLARVAGSHPLARGSD